MNIAADEKKIADYIWRSYKLKYIVLFMCLALLWLVSSAVRTGELAVRAVNQRSVEARQKWMERAAASKSTSASASKIIEQLESTAQSLAVKKSPHDDKPGDYSLKDPASAPAADEAESRLWDFLLPTIQWDQKSENGRRLFEARQHELQQLIRDRENAYNLEFSVSYLKNTVILNALSIIDVWPVIVVLVVALVFGIGFRQRAFEIILSSTMYQAPEGKERAIQSAATGFSAGTLTPHLFDGEPILVYRRPMILIPEPLITLCLVLAVAYLSLNIPQVSTPGRVLMRSSLLGFHTVVVIIASLLILILAKTKSHFDSEIAKVSGNRVFSRTGLRFHRLFKYVVKSISRSRVRDLVLTVSATVALASLALPWIADWNIFGYELFLPQTTIGGSGKIVFYKVDPAVFNEMRWQLIIAIIFVACVLIYRAISRLRLLQIYRRFIEIYSLVILIMIVNMLSFLVLLDYRQDREVVQAVLGMIWGNGDLEGPRGFPLVFQEPMYGFYIFVLSLSVICLVIGANAAFERNIPSSTVL